MHIESGGRARVRLGGMLRKILGIALYFTGLGLWLILFCVAAFSIVPWLVFVYIAGYLSHVREWPELRNFLIWQWVRDKYFNFMAYGGGAEVNDDEAVVYAIYPHGHFAITPLFYFALNPRFKDAKPAVHSALFWIPVFATIMRWIGAIEVRRETMLETLRSGKSIYMTPGGLADIANTGHCVKKRSGFLEVAKEAGVRVVPIWCPLERSYYSQWLPFGRTLEPFFSFPVPIFLWGLWWFPFLPRGSDWSPVCFGDPIDPARHDFYAELEQLQINASKLR